MRTFFGLVLFVSACFFLTSCYAFRDIYGGNKRLAKQYKAQLVNRYGKQLSGIKVWVADDGNYLTINFKNKGLPVRSISSVFSTVTNDNANEIAVAFLNENRDVFGAVGSDFVPEKEDIQIIPRDTVTGHHAAYLTQIYKGIPVNPEDSGEYRYMAPLTGNVDVVFSDSLILMVRSGAVRDTSETQ